MEAWRSILSDGLKSSNEKAAKQVEALKTRLSSALPKKKCVLCDVDIAKGDLLALNCSPNTSHSHCFDCLQEIVEKQRGYYESRRGVGEEESCWSEEEKQYKLLWDGHDEEKTCVILCTICLKPAVVYMTSAVATGFTNTNTGKAHLQFKLLSQLTDLMRDDVNHRVVEYYENQRRWLFGKFKENFDSRKAKSKEDGSPLDARTIEEECEAEWVWLNRWQFDRKNGDPSGWKYGVNWPGGCCASNTDYRMTNAPSNTTFVRHRRMRRTKVKFSAQMADMLRKINTGDEEAEQAMHQSFAPNRKPSAAPSSKIGFRSAQQQSVTQYIPDDPNERDESTQ